jgi:hypothetical protein
LISLRFGKYTFRCVFENDAELPPYKGSSIRGVFGHSLKKIVCALKKKDCADCLLAGQCLYPTVFEMPEAARPANSTKRIPPFSHPYVIEPPPDAKTHFRKGDDLSFTLLLFGQANEHLAYFIYAFEQIGSAGIGKMVNAQRGHFILEKVLLNEQVVYEKTEGKILCRPDLENLSLESTNILSDAETADVEIALLTPLRLKYKNSLHAELPFHILTRAMLRRISSLFEYHGEGEPALDYRGLIRRACNIETKESHIGWYDWRRYSNRQEQAMMMGGMVGKIIYQDVPGEYLPLLKFCELAHLGKATTFGLGKIKVTQM